MAMARTSAFFLNATSFPPSDPLKHPKTFHTHILFNSQYHKHKRIHSLLALASCIASRINVDYLKKEFGGHGVSFEGIGDSCVIKMAMDNGSVANVVLPSGLITSYKPLMWHGATMEVLQTAVSKGQHGEAVIRGGVSSDFKLVNDGGIPWSPSAWSLQNVRGSPEESIQVELVSIAPEKMIEVKCLVTLHQDLLGSEFTINNTKSSSIQLSGSVISHLKVSTPDATYAVGLQGSNYRSKQPIMSEFSIVLPDTSRKGTSNSGQSLPQKALQSLFSRQEIENENEGFKIEESEGEEDDDYAHMTERMSRIYSNAPREFTIIDRGRRNSVVIRKSGFDEFYVFSPGSKYEWYGKYAYVCIGSSTTLTPLVLSPGGTWRGAQYLYNPNL
uniref:Protein NDH-DEPENDENT CYCLIC ELECTRON FLOW 5 n=1 Tax=Elaeis guineensis var. tenera TaxID=51953 RepID=A0A6I9RUR4_ELAGV|nr:protein NDH-DEPENDENT CYCLIC ELECTRON FLOW 5 [Elaeis guineensis]